MTEEFVSRVGPLGSRIYFQVFMSISMKEKLYDFFSSLHDRVVIKDQTCAHPFFLGSQDQVFQ